MPDQTGYQETQDGYFDGLTLLPSDLASAIVFESYNAAITIVVAQKDSANRARFMNGNEVTFGPGLCVLKGASGIKIRSATPSTPAIVNAVMYFEGEPISNITPNSGALSLTAGSVSVDPIPVSGGGGGNFVKLLALTDPPQDGTNEAIDVGNLNNLVLNTNDGGMPFPGLGELVLGIQPGSFQLHAQIMPAGQSWGIYADTVNGLGIQCDEVGTIGVILKGYLKLTLNNNIVYIPFYQ
jgi:hypothetical protein